MSDRTRTIYFFTLCWVKNGEIFEDPPSDEDFEFKDEAIARAMIASDGCKPGFFYSVWEMEQKWDEDYREWVAGSSKIVYKTKRGKAK